MKDALPFARALLKDSKLRGLDIRSRIALVFAAVCMSADGFQVPNSATEAECQDVYAAFVSIAKVMLKTK